ncbi:class I tRNA ligase family protein [Treponema phagedenis]|uniref:class I tRNA ligase family protein n=1 Tax=Treponema phagedenis TaxID=162 RepID=UPI0021CC7BCB|nr:class I tRNA ligase family protein [Treponema phagedenis]
MSKSLRNYTDPNTVVNEFGAGCPAFIPHALFGGKADDLKYSDECCARCAQKYLIPLGTVIVFYVTYANIDKVTPPAHAKLDGKDKGIKEFLSHVTNPLDRWILSITEKLVFDVTAAMDAYDLSKAIDPIVSYIDQLNNWYIRRSRRRFGRARMTADKAQAYETL